MDEVKAVGANEERAHLAGYQPQTTLARLQTVARGERFRIESSGAWEKLPESPALSSDDQIYAYRQGAKKELTAWYFEQKREQGFGNGMSSSESIAIAQIANTLGYNPPKKEMLHAYRQAIAEQVEEYGSPVVSPWVDDQKSGINRAGVNQVIRWYHSVEIERRADEKFASIYAIDSEQIARNRRDEIVAKLTRYAEKQDGLTFVNAEAQMSRNLAAQLNAGRTEITLGQRYATHDIEEAKGRHMAAVENIWPLIEQARATGVAVDTGHAVAGLKRHAVPKEIMAIADTSQQVGIGY